MQKPDRDKVCSFAILIVFFLFLVSCNTGAPTDENYPAQQNEITPATTVIFIQESALVYTSFKEIVESSDIILIGKPIIKLGFVNTARDQKDLSKEDPEIFGIGQIYQVQVETYLVGDGPKDILLIQNLGDIQSPSQDITNAEIEKALKKITSLPLTIDRRYIMFLSLASFDYGDFKKDSLYIGRGHPWRFEITNTGCVQSEDSIELSEYFPLQTLDDFVLKINNPEAYQNIPYPAPEIPLNCLPLNQKAYPVP